MTTPTLQMLHVGADRLEECYACFDDSALHERYFAGSDRLEVSLRAAVQTGDLWAATASNGEIVAVMHIEEKGFFGVFPYLALFGVKKGWRGMGVGQMLLKVYEDVARSLGYKRTSMMVSAFNPRAKALYQKMGYRKIGFLPNAVKEGIDENIMVKDL